MTKKVSVAAFLVFLVVSAVSFAIRVEVAEASGTIYIRADGQVYPSTAPITRDGNVYTLTNNVSESIVVQRSNIVLDGAGFKVEGLGELWSVGIDLSETSDVTLRNIEVRSFWYGVFLNMTSNALITEIIAKNSNDSDIYSWNSTFNTVIRNNLSNVEFWYSSNNTIEENSVKMIRFPFSDSNNIIQNEISGGYFGIEIGSYNYVYQNNITYCLDGITVDGTYNRIFNNNIINSTRWGVHLYWDAAYNMVYGNNIVNNSGAGIYLDRADGNTIFHNNLINNGNNVYADQAHLNLLDAGYPLGGNYWSNYTGVDKKSGPIQNEPRGDGIGDVPHIVDSEHVDNFPLMGPINYFNAGTWNQTDYFVEVFSNSTVSYFHFNPDEGPFLKFNVTGENMTKGFCRVTIPKDLLRTEDVWTIMVGDQQIFNYSETEDQNNTYLYFAYNHSTQTVTIQGTQVIPEFPSIMILPMFMILSVIAFVTVKKIRYKKAKT
jgi:parallel beta-helix repeat protein